MSVAKNADLLIELLTEELPPSNLEHSIANSFSEALSSQLKNFVDQPTEITTFVTPRRFGCIIHNVRASEANRENIRRGPAISNNLINQEPSPALLGFAKSCKLNWQQLEQNNDGYFYGKISTPGQSLEDVLVVAINTALKKLSIAKNMRWGNNDYSFVRPIHNLLILHGNRTITLNNPIMGLTGRNYTFGHRVMSAGKIVIEQARDYLPIMATQGMVIANFKQRMENITAQLNSWAKTLGLEINPVAELLVEVTALVEFPVVLQGKFSPEFLQIPQECLILSMAKHQKYFALLDNGTKKLSNKFLFVANIKSTNPAIVVAGNEKVLNARLQDAKFFFEVDKKTGTQRMLDKLHGAIYHNQLGSQLERITRLQDIGSTIAKLLNVDPAIAKHTAYLLKADLASEMVGEFPELQGIMGKHYAKHQGETDEVANAIEKHYYPRFSSDELPDSQLAITMALTDKLEVLVGIWGLGLQPTGDKDPFAIRRSALGIIRIILQHNLDIIQLLEIAYAAFATKIQLKASTISELYQFIRSRLENYLALDYPATCIKSILYNQPRTFTHIPGLLDNLSDFARTNAAILQANKRIENILRKNAYLGENKLPQPEFKAEFLKDDAEKALYAHWNKMENSAALALNNQDWSEYFTILSSFNPVITAFFTNVMVMTTDLALQKNRIALLFKFHTLANKLCRLAELDQI